MTRTTIVDVRRVFTERYVSQLQTLGYPTDGLSLERTESRAFIVVDDNDDRRPGPGVVGNGMEAGMIGGTAAEAYETLVTIAKTLEFAGGWMVQNAERVLR
ncbi:hypothetical protein SEA_MARKY_73 [Streptomyces phage Marky]|nr:hypothetical protein SEA_MARKY_73 [Streptomyces phage Marky]